MRQGQKKPWRPLALRLQLYEAVMTLRAESLSYNAIIRAVEKEFSVRLSKSHVSNWTRGLNVPDGSVTDFVPTPSADLGYVVGTMLGDGSTSAVGDHNYRLKLQVNDKDFAEAFSKAVRSLLNRFPPRVKFLPKKGAWYVEVSSLLLFQFIRSSLTTIRAVVEQNDECSGGFLRGFFDSEGNVYEGSVTASNSDKDLLELVLSQLHRLGIETTGPRLTSGGGHPVVIKGRTCWANHDCFVIRIRNASRTNFLRKVGFEIKRKRDILSDTLNTTIQSQKEE